MFSTDDFESQSFFRLDRLPARPRRHATPTHGDARLASESDLRPFLDRPDEERPARLDDVSLLTVAAAGDRYAPVWKIPLHLPAEVRRRNILAVGPIGCGKTSEFILPLAKSDIEDPEASVVIVDIKGDLRHKLAPFAERSRPGAEIAVLNLTDPERTTHAWNPFAHQNDEGVALDDAETFCQAAQSPRAYRDSPFWDGSAARWIAALSLCLKRNRGAVCPADVHRALELPRDNLLALLAANPDVAFAPGVHAFLASGSHNAETVQAHAQMNLRALRDPALAAVTSADEFRFSDLFERPMVLIVELPQGGVEKLRPYVNLFFAQLFREAAQRAAASPGCRLPRPLNLYLDDFAAAVGRIPDFGQHLNLSRSRDIRVVAAVQSLSQIEHHYGSEAHDILSGFVTKLFKTPERHDAEWASRQSGICTVEAVDEIREAPEDGDEPSVVTRTTRPVARPLLTPEEIRHAPEHFLYGRAWTFFIADAPPVQGWLRAAHHLPGMAGPMAEAERWPRPARLRRTPLRYAPADLAAAPKAAGPTNAEKPLWYAPKAAGPTNAENMTEEQVLAKYREVRETLDWANTTGSARKWWEAFETENRERIPLVVRLAEELASRGATITEFFLAYVYSNTDNIQANLHYLDYTRLKKEEERRQREKAEAQRRPGFAADPAADGPEAGGEGVAPAAKPPDEDEFDPELAQLLRELDEEPDGEPDGRRGERRDVAGETPRQSGDVCPPGAGGVYAFDAYLDGRKTPRPRVSDRTVRVEPGEVFPPLRSSGAPCWWRRTRD